MLRGVTAIREVLEKDQISPEGTSRNLQPVFLKYQTVVVEATHGVQGNMRNLRELRILATALDLLIEGKQVHALDLLCQRFKAVELAMNEGGNWMLAQHLELLPQQRGSVVQDDEKEAAVKLEMKQSKLRGLMNKERSPGGKGGKG